MACYTPYIHRCTKTQDAEMHIFAKNRNESILRELIRAAGNRALHNSSWPRLGTICSVLCKQNDTIYLFASEVSDAPHVCIVFMTTWNFSEILVSTSCIMSNFWIAVLRHYFPIAVFVHRCLMNKFSCHFCHVSLFWKLLWRVKVCCVFQILFLAEKHWLGVLFLKFQMLVTSWYNSFLESSGGD